MKDIGLKDKDDGKCASTKEISNDFDILRWIDEVAGGDIPLDKDMFYEQQEYEILEGISASLGRQVCREIAVKEAKSKAKRRKGFSRPARIAGIAAALIMLLTLFLIFTPIGRNFLWDVATDYAYGKMIYEEGEVSQTPPVKEVSIKNAEADALAQPFGGEYDREKDRIAAVREESIINILLLGEEAIDSGGSRGRTDVMIVASMNTEKKTVKLISFMRDMLVEIPGYGDNKLNAAYQTGGVPLLYETLEANFHIKLNGYAKVDFDDFEEVIDKLGGVRISLTAKEAGYLNSTNYISKPEFRTVASGEQVLNGNQALGYCRIRYVRTVDNEADDYGRTTRQRAVLNALFEQYKSKSIPEILLLADDILGLITTDITKEAFGSYLKTAVTGGLSDMENLRIPADDTFEEGYAGKMSVLIPDLQANTGILKEFIYGEDKASVTE